MLIKKKRLGILTEIERDRLTAYDKISTVEKKNLNFRLKKKLSIIKEALEDINLLLNILPEDLTKEYIDNETALCSIKATERMLKLLDPFPIETGSLPGKMIARKQNLIDFSDSFGMTEFRYNPTPGEADLWQAVQEHIAVLQKVYDVNNLDLNTYTLEEYKEKMVPVIKRLQMAGIKYTVETNPSLIPGNVPVNRSIELGYGGNDLRLSMEEQQRQREENERQAQRTREKERKSK